MQTICAIHAGLTTQSPVAPHRTRAQVSLSCIRISRQIPACRYAQTRTYEQKRAQARTHTHTHTSVPNSGARNICSTDACAQITETRTHAMHACRTGQSVSDAIVLEVAQFWCACGQFGSYQLGPVCVHVRIRQTNLQGAHRNAGPFKPLHIQS